MEDIGYMARIIYPRQTLPSIRTLRQELHPMLIGTGCSVPGIMASRTIESQRDRRMTIINTPMIPCGMKLPIIARRQAVFGGPVGRASCIFLGTARCGRLRIILKKTKMFRRPFSFRHGVAGHHVPSVGNVARYMGALLVVYQTGRNRHPAFGVVLWFLLHFAVIDGSLIMIEDEMIADNIAAKIGQCLDTSSLLRVRRMAGIARDSHRAHREGRSHLHVRRHLQREDAIGIVEKAISPGSPPSRSTSHNSRHSLSCCSTCSVLPVAAMGAIKREMNSAK